ncbi:hypothetical protein BDY19DRAFT_766172 [Irpex rosettiformis]|uniref:Uncharacterized protein n=1 Tax=Irpex rosettiformis TaxID=378272 RepID=A0ACB8U878_9APHY|nr:hypothetical protein BDY19DRAFT_766172 [Irpex rosettiformis]
MSQAHSPYTPNSPQEYGGYQYRNVLPQPPSPRYNHPTSSPLQPSHYYDPQHQPNPAFNPAPQPYSPQQLPFNSSLPPHTPLARSPIAPPIQRSPMAVAIPPQGQLPPSSAYNAIMQGIESPASVPPMPQNFMFNQSPYQPSRRPLPTPNGIPNTATSSGVARPYTQPPLSRRPLPQPHASPSAPNTPFRHRPSASVVENNSASGISSRSVLSTVQEIVKY